MAALASDWLRHIRLLLWNHWTEFNETWQEARSQRPLPSLCFSGRSEKQDGRPSLWDIFDFFSETAERNSTKLDRKQDLKALYQVCVFWADRKNKMAALASDWPRHFRLLLWNHWMEFNETWQEARSQRPLPSLWFSGRSEKQDGRPGLWLAETFSTSPLQMLNEIQRNLTGSKILMPSTKFVFFGPIRKTRWPPWPLIGWDIFDFSSATTEWNSTKLDRKRDLNALYQVCVFRADRKNKMAALASDWLRHFQLLLWNRWTEFNESWQEARSQRPLPNLCFSGRSEKQDGRLASDWLRYFRLLLWNRWMEFNETWQESRSKQPLPSLCFLGRSEKQMAALASDWLRHFRLLLWNRWTEFSETWQEASSQCLLPQCVFQANREQTKWPPWPLIGWDIFDFSSETVKGIRRNLIGSKISKPSTNLVFFRWIGKTKWPPWPLIGWEIFWLFLWNRWTEFSKTWQEARS